VLTRPTATRPEATTYCVGRKGDAAPALMTWGNLALDWFIDRRSACRSSVFPGARDNQKAEGQSSSVSCSFPYRLG
jgi:hypothetical protein